MGWLPAAISGAGSLIEGYLGMKTAKKNRKAARRLNQNRISWTVEDANRAGIHPLAALGATAAGGFVQPVHQNYAGDAIGGAFDAIASGMQTGYQQDLDATEAAKDRVAYGRPPRTSADIRRNRLQNDLLRAQIEATRSRTRIMRARAAALGGAPDVVASPNAGDVFVDPWGGEGVRIGPGVSSRQIEDEYGGFMGEIYGIGKWLRDSYGHFFE